MMKMQDVLHLVLSDEPEASSIELSPHITAELNEAGELIGIEILDATKYLRDSILESVQAKMLRLSHAGRIDLDLDQEQLRKLREEG